MFYEEELLPMAQEKGFSCAIGNGIN
jgi:hypothetical protein